MKSQLPKLLAIFGLILSLIIVFSTYNGDKAIKEEAENQNFKEYPNEWMYNQRAFPDNYINKEAMQKAIVQSQSITSTRAAGTDDWSLIGPLNTGGRITDAAIDPEDDNRLYVSTAVGGVFRTTDKGQTWEAIFDEIGKPSIGNIAIAPSDGQRIYVGTGEANASATSGAFVGDGIYRSDDGGDTWNNIGLNQSEHIGRIVVDPTDPDRIFVAATGTLYGTNTERGIYRTTDGGTTWEQVLFVTDFTAAIDVAMNPSNTDIIYAAMWERIREPWQRDYGGLTSAVHRSLDGGDTWELLGNGLPAPDEQTGRIGLAVSESDPATVYARYTTNEITNSFDALYKSEDNGDSWNQVPTAGLAGIDASFGWYFGNIRVRPDNPDEVYILGQSITRTTTAGASWIPVNGMHVDHHALEYSRNNTDFILAGNDGGAYISEDSGISWTKFRNLPITQFYNIEVDFQEPERLYGGTQDNNTIRTLTGSGDDWTSIWGGDGFHVNVDPSNNNFVYAESQFGNLGRSTDGGNTFVSALTGIDPSDRTNWNTPVILSPFDPSIAYYGSNKLYSSTRAIVWTAISDDLTNGQHPSGSLSYGTLTAIAASYNNLETIYTGSDDGNVNVTFDGGSSWTNISAGLPNRYITSLAISPEDDQTIYVTLSGFSALDFDPHIFKSTDGGLNWTPIASNLPNIPVNDIIIADIEGQEYLFAATDLNVWYSDTDGTQWDILGNNLPLTIIRDLKYHGPTKMLYAGTFGRSMHRYDLESFILGLSDTALSNSQLSLYPNPAKEVLYLKHNLTGIGSMSIYSLSGQKVKQLFRDRDVARQENKIIENIDLPSGMYILELQIDGKTLSRKLLLE